MSTKAEVSITFNHGPLPFEMTGGLYPKEGNPDDLRLALLDFYGTRDAHIQVYDLKYNEDNEVYFELYSDRLLNLKFQVDTLTKFLQARYCERVENLTINVWSCLDDYGVYFQDGDGVDFNLI